ncbi:hypothetical protein [Alteribacillus sp. YIM 98480]|uniref:hypothetical protein n=1 Tax=Alteribacillus sp. YIM 98480 TaxID=2606599 RepID=UPI00131C4531|nr:hypothetical protein [Alteribacillus sp. YIM 98480]
MKIEILRSVAGVDFSYPKGKTVEIDKERAEKLIKAGHAKPAGEQKATKTAPENATTKRKTPAKKKSDD